MIGARSSRLFLLSIFPDLLLGPEQAVGIAFGLGFLLVGGEAGPLGPGLLGGPWGIAYPREEGFVEGNRRRARQRLEPGGGAGAVELFPHLGLAASELLHVFG